MPVEVDGKRFDGEALAARDRGRHAPRRERRSRSEPPCRGAAASGGGAGSGTISAPMQGTIVKVLVAVGDSGRGRSVAARARGDEDGEPHQRRERRHREGDARRAPATPSAPATSSSSSSSRFASPLGGDGNGSARLRPMTELMEYEAEQVATANASGKKPIVFVHGLWLLPSSWDRWAEHFEAAGYSTVTAGWPDDPNSVDEANRHPEVFAKKSVQQVADHVEGLIRELKQRPAVVGHSFGGLLTEILAGRGCSDASVAISPAPHRGVLPLPISALRSSSPVLRNPRNHRARGRRSPTSSSGTRSPTWSPRTRPHELYNTYAVPAAGLAALPGRQRQPQPVDRGEGQDQEPRPRPAAHRLRRRRTTPCRGRSPTRRTSASGATRTRSPRSSSSRTAATRSTIDHGWQKVADTVAEVHPALRQALGRARRRSERTSS